MVPGRSGEGLQGPKKNMQDQWMEISDRRDFSTIRKGQGGCLMVVSSVFLEACKQKLANPACFTRNSTSEYIII